MTDNAPLIDDLDKRLLNILQTNANLPLKDIAELAHSSPATCQRRINALIDKGIIIKQVAIVNPATLGLELSVFVMVEIDRQNAKANADFEKLVAKQKEIASCYEIAGDWDFLLLIHCKNMAEYHRFTREFFTFDNKVVRYQSQFVMNFAKNESKVELG